MIAETVVGSKSYCVLIPSAGRAAVLAKTLKKHPWLNDQSTFVGIDDREGGEYRRTVGPAQVTWVQYRNADTSVGFCREQLRREAVRHGYDYYLTFDDNGILKSPLTLEVLVKAAAEFPTQPCVMSGLSGFKKFVDKDKKLHDDRVVHGIRSVEDVGMILMCIPYDLYAMYSYPFACAALEDRHFILWTLTHYPETVFRICYDASFDKKRYQDGGQGSILQRQINTGRGLEVLARDFPAMVGLGGTIRTPWREVVAFSRGQNYTRRPTLGGVRKHAEVLMAPKKKSLPVIRKDR